MEIDTKQKTNVLTPTLSVSPAYSNLDQMGGVLTLTDAVNFGNGTGTVLSVAVVDKAKVAVNFDILFFNDVPVITSVDNAALSISDAEMASKFIGRLSVTAYSATAVNSDSTLKASDCGIGIYSLNATKNVYAILQATADAGAVFTSTTDLSVKITTAQD